MERVREAAALLSRPKPRKEEVRPLQSKWQVAQKEDRKPRPLSEVFDEFQGKVIKAAQELKLKLSGIEDPFLSELESTDDDPLLAQVQKEPTKKGDEKRFRGASANCKTQSRKETEQAKRTCYLGRC